MSVQRVSYGECKQCRRPVLYQGAEYCSPACYGKAYSQRRCALCEAPLPQDGTIPICAGGCSKPEQRSALLSPDGVYRYLLARLWGPEARVLYIGLNPSTADAELDDPTVNWWREFAQRHGYGGFVAGNLFAFRTSNPKELKDSGFLVGDENDYFIVEAAKSCSLVVACWGNSGGRQAAERGHHIELLLAPQDIYFFEANTDGSPRHPLARGAHRLDPQEATLKLWSCPF
jgi:hypothetical protein